MSSEQPDPKPTVRSVPVDTVRRTMIDVLTMMGAPEPIARCQAEHLVEGDLRGHPSHGLQRLPMLVARIRNGQIDPTTRGRHHWRGDALLQVEGEAGFGPAVAVPAVEAIEERATRQGIALAAIRDANHLGMLAPYVEHLAERGLVGVAWTTSEALVHPWGGTAAMVGTNPIAMAIPTSRDPVVLDLATGAISRGKVLDHANRDEPLPPGSVVDADGRPTTDPHLAVDGAISPFGGPKGYALGVGFELLVAALTASAVGDDVVGTLDADERCNKGDVLLAVDPAIATGSADRSHLDRFVAQLRGVEPTDPARPVGVPGDRARATRERNLERGEVPISVAIWDQVLRIVHELELPQEGSS